MEIDGKKVLFGTPYVVKCPNCGKLIVTSVSFGSGAFCCPVCSEGRYEPIRFDFVSAEAIKKNHEEYADILKDYLYE